MTARMPYTVLGAGGYVGSHLVAYLRRHGIAPYAPARTDSNWLGRPLGRVIYCIGLTADYASRPFETVEAHVTRFSDLLRHGDFESAVYLSSTRLYDGLTSEGTEDSDLVLNPQSPRHLYDLSKALGEALACSAGRPNVRAARLSCVYGGDLSSDNFLHQVVREAVSRASVALQTWPDSARDYVHIEDVCAALVAIANEGRQPIYNVASGENLTNRQLFEAVTRATGTKIVTVPPAGAQPPAPPRVDVTALAADFGLRPRSVQTALPELLDTQRRALARKRAS
jgi:nucleoside-diphosphate-sugar epimerase